jgi:predicted ATPase
VIASIAFHRFKALRATQVSLAPFNLVIGPNGSGKTSLIESIQRLRTLAALPVSEVSFGREMAGPEIEFRFGEPFAGLRVKLGCESDLVCDTLRLEPAHAAGWDALRREIATMRAYVLDHDALAGAGRRDDGAELAPDGGNLAAVLAHLQAEHPAAFDALSAEALRLMPEFRALRVRESGGGGVEFALELVEGDVLPAAELSQGTLYLLGLLALAFDPRPPRLLCIEEIDRGIHPRMLREVRDVLYRLSYPEKGSGRAAVQVLTTSHSPYFIDLFRDHPEEVIISQKAGRAARFERLSDRPDLPELLREGSLGDMWFSGILGGIPEER